MKKSFFTIILITQFYIVKSQKISYSSYSTKEIQNYYLAKGGDSTLKKFDCSFLALIDTTVCMYVLNSIANTYDKEPNLYIQNNYVHHFIVSTGLCIKKQRILNILKTEQFTYLKQKKNIEKIDYYFLSPLLFQIEKTKDDSLLLYFANAWKNKSKTYPIEKVCSFRKNLSIYFRDDYPKIARNYINCKKNEILFLMTYQRLIDKDNKDVNSRIVEIKKGLRAIKERFEKPDDDYFLNKKYNSTTSYQLKNSIENLGELNLKEYGKNMAGKEFRSIYLTLIYNENIGIITGSVGTLAHGYIFTYLVKKTNNILEQQVINCLHFN